MVVEKKEIIRTKIKEISEFKPNYTIAKEHRLALAQYKMTMNEQKFVYIVLSKIEPDDDDFLDYEFSYKTLALIMDVTIEHIYRIIDKLTTSLMKRIIRIEGDDGKIHKWGWFSYCGIDPGKGKVKVRVERDLKPYLLALKEKGNFGTYKLGFVLRFESWYSARFYELFKRYKYDYEHKFKIEELRFMFEMKKNEYTEIGMFKKRIIKPAQDELKEKSDIYFIFTDIKEGRKIVGFKFKVFTNKKNINLFNDKKVSTQPDFFDETDIKNNLISYGINPDIVPKLLEKHNNEWLIVRLKYFKEKLEKRNHGIKDKPAWLYQLITKKDWDDKNYDKWIKEFERSKKLDDDIKYNKLKKGYNSYIKENVIKWNEQEPEQLKINDRKLKEKEEQYSQNPAIKPKTLKLMLEDEKEEILKEDFKSKEPFKEWAINFCSVYTIDIPYQLKSED